MLTLALFSHSPGLAGAERMLLNLAILLKQSDSVRPVLLSPGEGDLLDAARQLGLAGQVVPRPPWYVFPSGDLPAYCRGATECRDAVKKMLVDLNSDAVLVNTMTNVPAMLAAVELGLPSLLWVHGVIDSMLLPRRSSEFAGPHDELLLHAATRVIALPNYTSDFCARVMGRADLDVIPNWTPVDRHFSVPPDKYRSRVFACLNTFYPHKGHATLLEAAALLKAGRATFVIDLYGDGPVRGEMKERTAALGLQDCVRFPGRTSDVEKVYDDSLCVLNPADSEPFPMTLLEPMARKTPVVATRSGGPSEIVVDGQCGYLVDRGDASAMADRMRTLLASPQLAQDLGEAGHARICTHFSQENARAAFLPAIEGAVHDFSGYAPAVNTLAKIYGLWLEQAGGDLARPTGTSLRMVVAAQKAVCLAARGLRRMRLLARQALKLLSVH